ncbi:hypothetical protein GPALN_010816 [Globodera pallida]|uniref:Uncharacterized protein n=1 Tax=Globodera rostochiensis TaxID=31243 RepID=A0A914H551_GLORO|nr:hypothetical protein GPALN_010816 [Globodera pallida]
MSKVPGGVTRFCPQAQCARLFAALFCALFALGGVFGMDNSNDDELRRHFGIRQQQFFAVPSSDGFDASAALIGVNPFAERLMFEKRLAPREIGKRERIIMDAMGGNDYLIKRSLGKK